MKIYLVIFKDFDSFGIMNWFLNEVNANIFIDNLDEYEKGWSFIEEIELELDECQELNRKIVDYLADKNI